MSTPEHIPAGGDPTVGVDDTEGGVTGSSIEMPATRPSHEPLVTSTSAAAAHKQSHHHEHHRRDNRHARPMGHYPPRPEDHSATEESRQDMNGRPLQPSPNATGTTNTHLPSTSLSELSTQFEETLEETIKPALHKFFYPPVSAERAAGHPERTNSHRRRASSHQQETAIHAGAVAPVDPLQRSPAHQKPPALANSAEDSQSHNTHQADPESNFMNNANNANDDNHYGDNYNAAAFQQEFDDEFQAQAEADRKYVERFWTVYDDIIMLSLFTQVGVVFRLIVSTWFTYFDGIFRSDSPLCTTLPLNCLSCFLMGLLGSGDRLMEMITTRFTPRKLQLQIKAEEINVEYDGDDDGDEYDDDDDDGHGNDRYDNQRHTTRRRRRRRPKRSKRPAPTQMDEVFHSWQPPIHWHDDLREVQLLALERRIRASKCLILFSVKKSEADLMEHYFDSPVVKRGRSRRGIPNSNEDDIGENDQEYGYDDYADGIGYANEQRGLSFDLELAESTDKSGDAQQATSPQSASSAISPSSSANLPPSVAKLIKRSPGKTPPSSPPRPDSTSSPVAGAPTDGSAPASRMQESSGQHQEIRHSDPSSPNQLSPSSPLSPTGESTNTAQTQTLSTEQVAVGGTYISQTTGLPVSTVAAAPNSQGGVEQDQCSVLTDENDQNLDQIILSVRANVSENVNRMRRVNLADGWDVGTTPEAMADDLMLGLRDGFCGALSSFSSWNSAMLILLREGHIGEALIGYMLGIQLPIVAYRFGQQVAVYYFVFRCRREAKRDERRGYGLRLNTDDGSSSHGGSRLGTSSGGSGEDFEDEISQKTSASMQDDYGRDVPSVRAVCTALFMLSLVSLFTALSFFSEPEEQQVSLSLLFSPLGSMARWRLSQFNCWRPGFPLGTFACNILACALSGSLGELLAGNPGPRERTVLVSLIAGFGGTLSSLATFIVEILAGVDPLLFRFDGFIYAIGSVLSAFVVGFVFEASIGWADDTTQSVFLNETIGYNDTST